MYSGLGARKLDQFRKLKSPSWREEQESGKIEERKCFEMRFERSAKTRPCRAFRLD